MFDEFNNLVWLKIWAGPNNMEKTENEADD